MVDAPRTLRNRGAVGTLVVLHGHGDEAGNALAWGSGIAPRGWRVEAVSAPSENTGEHSWFDTGPRGADTAELQCSIDVVRAAVGAVADRGPVVVAGFSQGAALALSLPRTEGLDAVVGICGFLPETDETDPGVGPQTLVVAADGDDVTPAFLSHDAVALMRAAGRDATAVTLSGGHEVAPGAAAFARRWIEDRLVPRMRFSVRLPADRVEAGAEFVSGEAVAELASTWERLGFDAAFVTDHPAPDERWLAAGGHHALEPTVALAVAAAATSELLLHTHVYVLGYRNPFLAAKALASLDVVSGGRLILGVAAGYLRPEFAAVGADFENRGARLEEAVSLLRRIWSGETVTVDGDGYSARSAVVLPGPVQAPGPPVWVGGNSMAAMRRAINHGQGWSPFPTTGGLDRATRTAAIPDIATLGERLDVFRRLCEEAELPGYPTVCFSPFAGGAYLADPDSNVDPLIEEIQGLFEMGVDWLTLGVAGDSRGEMSERAQELHEAITSAEGDSRASAPRV